MAVGALVVSILALGVSVFAVWWARKAANAQHRLTEIEETRETSAQLAVRFDTDERRTHYLVVENYGAAPAHDVSVDLVATGDGTLPMLHDVPFPGTIGARSEVRILAITVMGGTSHCNAIVQWRDALGPHEETFIVSTP